MGVEKTQKCLGYFGFGSGYTIKPGTRGYCDQCPLSEECWAAHKKRCAAINPDLVAAFEKKAKEIQGHGLIIWWFDKYGAPDPYTSVMAANMEDAVNINIGGQVKNRGLATLPYPFNQAN